MKKLKIILLFSCVFIFFRAIIFIQTGYYHSHYTENTNEIVGKVISYYQKGENLSIIIKAKEKVRINYDIKEGEKVNIHLGDVYFVKGIFKSISKARNFHLFDYANYMKSQKIYWQCTANKIEKRKKNTNVFYQIKDTLQQYSAKRKAKEYIQLFLFGEKRELNEEVLTSYQENGISHLFAISGMHVTLFTIVLSKILSFLFPKGKFHFVILFFFLLFYLFFANFLPSLLRSVAFFFLIRLNHRYFRQFHSHEILLYLFFLFLLVNPYYLYHIGFLFSFVVTFSIIVCKKIIDRGKHYLSRLFLTSTIAFVVSIPLVTQNYFSLNLLTPILNCLFVPLVTFVIFPLTLLTFVFPFCESLLLPSISLLENLSLFFHQLDMFTLSFSKIPSFFIIIYYMVISFIRYKMIYQKYRYIFLLFVMLFLHYLLPFYQPYPIITMLDVGQGDSILIELPYQKGNILIDTGGNFKNYQNENFQIAKKILIPYLKSRGIKKIDLFVVTHGDLDHLGEAIYLVEHFNIKKVVFNSGKTNELEKKLIKILYKKKIIYNTISKAIIDIAGQKLYFLNDRIKKDENEDSLILYTTLNQHNILLMGDAGEGREAYLQEKYRLPKIDILKVGHHGSKFSTSKSFLTFIRPEVALISCGKNNMFKHPSKETLTRLKNQHTIYYRTDIHGMIRIILKKEKKIQTVF